LNIKSFKKIVEMFTKDEEETLLNVIKEAEIYLKNNQKAKYKCIFDSDHVWNLIMRNYSESKTFFSNNGCNIMKDPDQDESDVLRLYVNSIGSFWYK